MNAARTPTPRLTIDTRENGDKEILVTGENLHISVDFDDVDHIEVARDIGLVVDACNSHDALVAALEAEVVWRRCRDERRALLERGMSPGSLMYRDASVQLEMLERQADDLREVALKAAKGEA